MSHRVIAGRARGMRLKPVPGNSTRPIMDRVKEALFSILGNTIIEARVLDLFAGTGAVGIEALSRGAEWVTFTELDKEAIKTIQDNLKTTKLDKQAEVIRTDAFLYLKRQDVKPYSLVYIAPPQYKELWQKALEVLDQNVAILEPDAIVIVQIDPKEQRDIALTNLTPYDERTYGKTRLWFFEYAPEGEMDEPGE